MKKLIVFGILILIIGAFIYGMRPQSQIIHAKPTVKIGVSLPITGVGAYVGQPAVTAANMALEKWTKKGTKYNYELVIEDDHLTAKGTAQAANKLLFIDKVNGVVSMWGFAGPLYMQLAKKANIPHITCAWGDGLSDGITNFNNTTSTTHLAQKLIDLLKIKNVKTIGYVSQLSQTDTFLKKNFLKEFEKNGIEVLWTEEFIIGNKDFKMFWTKISQKPVDMIVMTMIPEDMLPFLKQKNESGNTTDFTTIDFFSTLNSPLIEGKMYVRSSIGNDKIIAKINEQTPAKLGDCLINIYDNVDLLIYSFENAPTQAGQIPTTEAVADILRKVKDYPGEIGTLTVQPNGHLDSDAYIMKIENGKQRIIQ